MPPNPSRFLEFFSILYWLHLPLPDPPIDRVTHEVALALTIHQMSSQLTGGEAIRQATTEFLQNRVQQLGQASSELQAD